MRRFYYQFKTYLLHKKFKSERELYIDYPEIKISEKELLMKRQVYKSSHDNYVRSISSPEMAMSLELASFLALLVEKHKPTKILDLGSGYSTYLFNSIHQSVVSVDDNKDWLLKTEKYLIENNMKQYQLIGIDAFRELNDSFDLVFVDLNFVEERIKFTEKILSLLSNKAIVVFDDVHKDHYLDGLRSQLDMTKCYLMTTSTKDAFGRFSLLYKNA